MSTMYRQHSLGRRGLSFRLIGFGLATVLFACIAPFLTTSAEAAPASPVNQVVAEATHIVQSSPSVITLHMAEKRWRDTHFIYHSMRLNWLWKIPLQDGATDWAKMVNWHEATNFNGTQMSCGFWSKHGYTHSDFKLYIWQPSTGRHIYRKRTLNCQKDTTAHLDLGLIDTKRFYMPGEDDVGDQIKYRLTYVDYFIWEDNQSGQFQGHLQTY